jgi:hypothetical protein
MGIEVPIRYTNSRAFPGVEPAGGLGSVDVDAVPPGAVGFGAAEDLAGDRRDVALAGDQIADAREISEVRMIAPKKKDAIWRPSGRSMLLATAV